MAIRRHSILVIVCMALLSVMWTAQAQDSGGEALHIVMSVEGNAFISRYSAPGNLSDETVLTAGSFVSSQDIIEAGPGSRTVILCANRVTDEISNDLRAPNCAANVSDALVTFDNVEIYGQQRAALDDIVYVLSPRHSMIMTETPRLEWTPSENADSYEVILYNMLDNSIVWQRAGVQQSYLNYPEDEEPLPAVDVAEKPIRYQFVVTPVLDGQELRNFDPLRPEGFCIVSARHRPETERAIAEFTTMELDPGVPEEARSFNLAVYYHGHRLYSDALDELMSILPVPLDKPFPASEISAESIVGSPSYYILLGNVLYAQRLPLNEVQQAYDRAEDIALALDDTAALATINEQLADILRGRRPTITRERDAQIFDYYETAQHYYEELDNQIGVERINTKLTSPPELQTSDLCGS